MRRQNFFGEPVLATKDFVTSERCHRMRSEVSSWLSLEAANHVDEQQNVVSALAQIIWRLDRRISVGKYSTAPSKLDPVAPRLPTRHAAFDWSDPKLGLNPAPLSPNLFLGRPLLALFIQCGPIITLCSRALTTYSTVEFYICFSKSFEKAGRQAGRQAGATFFRPQRELSYHSKPSSSLGKSSV